MQNTNGSIQLPARTHQQAAALFRRPFAPGAIGFRAMSKVAYGGDPFGGAQVAAYVAAQSVLQRLNAVVPGRWRQEFRPVDPPQGAKCLYLACRLIVTLPMTEDGPDVNALYEDVGEMATSSRADLKALYSDARKRAAVAAGIGACLYTSLAAVVLPIGPRDRQVQLIRRSGRPDVLALSAATDQWLRHGYQQRIATEAVRRDLDEVLAHGEPEQGIGQGEAAEQSAGEPSAETVERIGVGGARRHGRAPRWRARAGQRRRGRRLRCTGTGRGLRASRKEQASGGCGGSGCGQMSSRSATATGSARPAAGGRTESTSRHSPRSPGGSTATTAASGTTHPASSRCSTTSSAYASWSGAPSRFTPVATAAHSSAS
jgi:hypothetical protein